MKHQNSFVISQFTNPSGAIVFQLYARLDGKRFRKNFPTRAEAEAERQLPRNHGVCATTPSPAITVAAEINRLHEQAKRCTVASRQALHEALAAAWHAGQLLLAEKKRVRRSMGPGAWLLWLEANFLGSVRTAQRYMKLAQCVADIAFLQGMSLRQAYARLCCIGY